MYHFESCLKIKTKFILLAVSEKEKLRGKEDPEKDDLNAPFGEYTRT